MAGIPLNEGKPATLKSDSEIMFDIIDNLCNRFTGISPLEILQTPYEDVMQLYTDVIIHDYKSKNDTQQDEWVTSKNATWH